MPVWAAVSIRETVPDLEAMQARMEAVTPKTVVVVFDISGSMDSQDTLINAREATIRLLQGAVRNGDRAVLTTFDVAPKTVFDRRIQGEADLQDMVDAVPGRTSRTQGTNIRWAHHRMLQLLEKESPPDSYVVLVTDSYNDPPAASDPHRADYLKYYTVNSLTKYPDTPENRDYERLLNQRRQLRVETMGIGVLIDEDTGRPREQWAAPPQATRDTTRVEESVSSAPARSSFNPWWIVAAVVAAALLLFLFMLRSTLAPDDVVLVEGSRQVGPFRMRPGSVVELGGAAHRGGEFGVPIPGTPAPVAYLRRAGGSYRLEPAPASDGQRPEVRINGEAVEKAQPLRFSDEIQVRLPQAESARPVRFTFERYTGDPLA